MRFCVDHGHYVGGTCTDCLKIGFAAVQVELVIQAELKRQDDAIPSVKEDINLVFSIGRNVQFSDKILRKMIQGLKSYLIGERDELNRKKSAELVTIDGIQNVGRSKVRSKENLMLLSFIVIPPILVHVFATGFWYIIGQLFAFSNIINIWINEGHLRGGFDNKLDDKARIALQHAEKSLRDANAMLLDVSRQIEVLEFFLNNSWNENFMFKALVASVTNQKSIADSVQYLKSKKYDMFSKKIMIKTSEIDFLEKLVELEKCIILHGAKVNWKYEFGSNLIFNDGGISTESFIGSQKAGFLRTYKDLYNLNEALGRFLNLTRAAQEKITDFVEKIYPRHKNEFIIVSGLSSNSLGVFAGILASALRIRRLHMGSEKFNSYGDMAAFFTNIEDGDLVDVRLVEEVNDEYIRYCIDSIRRKKMDLIIGEQENSKEITIELANFISIIDISLVSSQEFPCAMYLNFAEADGEWSFEFFIR